MAVSGVQSDINLIPILQLHHVLRPLAVLLFSAAAFACNSDDSKADCDDGSDRVCGVCDPAKNISWLRDEIAQRTADSLSSYIAIMKGTYKFKTVFLTAGCCPSCVCVTLVWNCEGQLLNKDDILAIDIHDIRQKEVIWQGENYTPSL